MALALAAGGLGYWIGNQNRTTSERDLATSVRSTRTPAPTAYPEWVDTELSLGPGFTVFVRCTFHIADGTVRVASTVTVLPSVGVGTSWDPGKLCPPKP